MPFIGILPGLTPIAPPPGYTPPMDAPESEPIIGAGISGELIKPIASPPSIATVIAAPAIPKVVKRISRPTAMKPIKVVLGRKIKTTKEIAEEREKHTIEYSHEVALKELLQESGNVYDFESEALGGRLSMGKATIPFLLSKQIGITCFHETTSEYQISKLMGLVSGIRIVNIEPERIEQKGERQQLLLDLAQMVYGWVI